EGVALGQFLTVVIPAPPHLSATAHVRDGVGHAPVEQGQAGDREARILADLVRAVAVQERRSRRGLRRVATPHDRDRDTGAVVGRGPLTTLLVVGRVKYLPLRIRQ